MSDINKTLPDQPMVWGIAGDCVQRWKQGAFGDLTDIHDVDTFHVTKEEWVEEPGVSDHNPRGVPERTILGARVVR